MTLLSKINSSDALPKTLAFAISIALLVCIAIATPDTKHTIGFEVNEGAWEIRESGKVRNFRVVADVPLSFQVPEKFLCCNGRYRFSIHTPQILKNSSPPHAVFFPAIGGKFEIKVNGMKTGIPFQDYSSIGPIVPLDSTHLLHDKIGIDLDIADVSSRFHGLWRGPLIFGNLLELDRVRRSEYNFQVILPTFISIFLFIGAIAFLAIYHFTGRRFTPYLQFSVSLILFAIFSLFLSGLIRDIDINVSALLHYPARILAAISPFIIITNLQVYFSSPTNRISNREFVLTISALLVAGLFSVCANAAGYPICGSIAMVLILPLPAWPLIKWDLRNCRVHTMNFVSFTVALTAGIAWASDATKVAFELSGHAYPINFYDRITTTALIGFSFIFFIRHFIGLSNELAKEKIESAKSHAIARTVKMVAHDVRRPFTMIQMATETLTRLPQERIPQFVGTLKSEIEGNLRNVDSMLRDVLDFGTNSKLTVSEIDLRDLINEAVNYAISQGKPKKINLDINVKAANVLGDRHKISRALINVVDNAFAAVNDDGTIKIETSSSSDYATIEVFNEGSFIEGKKRDQIFNDYFTEGKPHGTGLGLAIAKQFIESHGGKIWCESHYERGTSFYIMLPIDQASAGRALSGNRGSDDGHR